MGKKQRTGTAPPKQGAWLATAPPKPVKLPAFLPVLPPTDEYFPIPAENNHERPPATLDATGAVRVVTHFCACAMRWIFASPCGARTHEATSRRRMQRSFSSRSGDVLERARDAMRG